MPGSSFILYSAKVSRIFGWTIFSHYHYTEIHAFRQNFQCFKEFVYYFLIILVAVELPLCIVVIVVTLSQNAIDRP